MHYYKNSISVEIENPDSPGTTTIDGRMGAKSILSCNR